jgi:Tfp pilus assembly protein PilF
VPFFLLSAASSAITCWAQGAAMPTLDYLPISDRVGNALIAYSRYLGKLFWPTNLAVFYPHPGTWPLWSVIGAGVMVGCVSLFLIWKAARKTYLIVGWFWFLGTLVPVIGLVQVGSQSIADRYTYIPYIGLFIIISWGLFEISQIATWKFGGKRNDRALPVNPGPHPQRLTHRMGEGDRLTLMERMATVSSLAVLIACMVLTRKQLDYWQDSETLFKHALAVTEYNITAHFSLGKFYGEKGRSELALEQLQEALRIKPDFADVQWQVGQILASQGRLDEAIEHYRTALELKPGLGEALNNLAWVMATHPDPRYRNGEEAVRLGERACETTQYQRTIFIGTLAAAYAEAGRFSDAIRTAQQAIALAQRWDEKALLLRNQQLLQLYQAGQPCRDDPRH